MSFVKVSSLAVRLNNFYEQGVFGWRKILLEISTGDLLTF